MSGQQTTENQSIDNRENAVLSVDLRDYFAAAALQGLLAYDGDCSTAIGLAYHTADAMLDWRKKNQ